MKEPEISDGIIYEVPELESEDYRIFEDFSKPKQNNLINTEISEQSKIQTSEI